MNTGEDDVLNESLSALADGRATPADWARVNAAWAQDAALRERWALWQAAGDGLRAPELVAHHREPQALLAALHAQLPTAAAQSRRPRRDWFAPMAVAAGFFAVAVGVTLQQPEPPGEGGAAVAVSPRPLSLVSLEGASFAQTVAGPAAPVAAASPAFSDWPQGFPEGAASAAQP